MNWQREESRVKERKVRFVTSHLDLALLGFSYVHIKLIKLTITDSLALNEGVNFSYLWRQLIKYNAIFVDDIYQLGIPVPVVYSTLTDIQEE